MQKRAYRIKNVEKCRAANRAYYYDNWVEMRCHNAQYIRDRLKEDSEFRLMWNLRGRTREAIKRQEAHKQSKFYDLLGCTIGEARVHLEKQFKSGMSWENYGLLWEIDHIRPCASFDLTDLAQQKECFHFSNLRPLTIFDNRSKGAKWL